MPFSESASPAKRPSITERQSSTHSVTKASPSNKAKQHRTHAVGHGRLGTRNLSHGKNLNKLTKLTGDDAAAAKAQKTKAQTPPTSPGAPAQSHMKRNSSTVSLPRVASKSSIKRNHSNVSLKRNSSSGHVNKLGKGATSSKRPHSSHSEPDHMDDKPTAAFIMDETDDYGAQDDEWTEESASQSPSTTRRSSTSRGARSGKATPAEDYNTRGIERAHPSDLRPGSPGSSSSQDGNTKQDSDYTMVNSQMSLRGSRPPDAAAIASRLLGRNSSSQLPPKVHYASAMGTQTPPLQRNQSFNLSDSFTPDDGVSRFLNAPASSGGSTHHLHDALNHASASPPSPMLRSQSPERSPSPGGGGKDGVRRVKSTGDFLPRAPTITQDKTIGNAPPSYTFEQQDRSRKAYTLTKMNFWKAHMDKPEHGSVIPVVVKGVPLGMLGTEERHVRQWEDARVEMDYLRRFQRPLVESVKRAYKPSKLEIQHAREQEASRALAREGPKDRRSGPTTSQNGKGDATGHSSEEVSAARSGTKSKNTTTNSKTSSSSSKASSSKDKERAPVRSNRTTEGEHSERRRGTEDEAAAASAHAATGKHDDLRNGESLSRTNTAASSGGGGSSGGGRSRTVRFEGGLEPGGGSGGGSGEEEHVGNGGGGGGSGSGGHGGHGGHGGLEQSAPPPPPPPPQSPPQLSGGQAAQRKSADKNVQSLLRSLWAGGAGGGGGVGGGVGGGEMELVAGGAGGGGGGGGEKKK